MSEKTIIAQVPDWMDKEIGSRAKQKLITKNAVVLQVLADAIAESKNLPPIHQLYPAGNCRRIEPVGEFENTASTKKTS